MEMDDWCIQKQDAAILALLSKAAGPPGFGKSSYIVDASDTSRARRGLLIPIASHTTSQVLTDLFWCLLCKYTIQ